jgi:hypothetical protein
MRHELAALAPVDRGGDADFDPELIGAVGLALADAFDLGGVERINFGSALAAILAMNPAGEMPRPREDALEFGASFDLALDVADDAAEIGSERAQRLVGALELMGVGLTLMLDQGMLADPRVRLAQCDAPCLRHPHQPFARPLHQPGIGREQDILGLHGRIDDDPREIRRLLATSAGLLSARGKQASQMMTVFVSSAPHHSDMRGHRSRQYVLPYVKLWQGGHNLTKGFT